MTLKRTYTLLITLLIAAVCYEAWRVFEARAATPDLLMRIERLSDPSANQLSPRQTDILIIVEDPTFWTNNGLDFKTPGQGLTTLTQALAKQLYFDRFTPGLKKLELILISRFALSTLATKHEILQAFLAVAYLGQDDAGPVVGFSQATQRWYGKALSELTEEEFAGLVAMLIAPNTLDPKEHPQENRQRVDRIKQLIAMECAPTGLLDVALVECSSS